MADISTLTFFGRAAACTVSRAGKSAEKYEPYIALTAAKSPMFLQAKPVRLT